MGNLRFRQVHLDFHTSEKIIAVGDRFDPAEFAQTLKKAGVNSITCFARCHHGMIYYDTRFPARHPGLKRNLLREQVDACHAVGIKIPIYITAGWDEYMAARHPEWLERTPEGKPFGAGPLQAGWKTLCFNTPYVDYIEDQTLEVLEKFGKDVDGLFFDIIFQDPCCCNYCMTGMFKEGLDPENEIDRKRFADKVLLAFKNRISKAVRKHNSECTIFYNAGHVNPDTRNGIDTYTHLELESLPSGGWGYDHFPITVRFAKNLGIEYLGMTGKFHKSWADFGGFKNQAALEYECFTALANGAKCSIGDQLHPDGSINKATYELIGSVYNQVKEKEKWCDDVNAVSEIAIFTPEAAGRSKGRIDPSIGGAYRMLEESHYQFDVVDDKCDFDRYKVIILPDVITLDKELKDKLAGYTRKGGKIMASFKSGMNQSEDSFILEGIGVELVGAAEFTPDYIVAGEKISQNITKTEYVMYDAGLYVKPAADTRILAEIWNPYFNRTYRHFCSHNQTPVEKVGGYPAITGNGGIIYFSHPIFTMYRKHGARVYKQLVLNCLEQLLEDRLVICDAPSTANINLNYQSANDRYVLHILHYIPERRCEEIDTIEDIIPLYNLEFKVKLPEKPASCYLVPSLKSLDCTYENGYTVFNIPEVCGHQMVILEIK